MFRRACRALGIEGQRLHGLRHAFATALFGGGVDARTVQELLGHGSLDVTMRYAHTSKERKRAAGRVFEGFRLLAAVSRKWMRANPKESGAWRWNVRLLFVLNTRSLLA